MCVQVAFEVTGVHVLKTGQLKVRNRMNHKTPLSIYIYIARSK